MKKIQLILTKVFSISLVVVLLSSCTKNEENKMQEETSKYAIAVSDNIISTYKSIDSLTIEDKFNQDMMEVLSNPFPDSTEAPDKSKQDFGVALNLRIEAFRLLKDVFVKFHLISDINFDDSESSTDAMMQSYSAIKDNAKHTITDDGVFNSMKRSDAIGEHSEFIYTITDQFLTVWKNDTAVWNKLIDRIYDDYMLFYASLPAKKFDIEKVKKLTEAEPYSNSVVLVNLYKIKVRKEAEQRKFKLKNNLDLLTKSFEFVTNAFKELSAKDVNQANVVSYLNRTKESLDQMNK